MLLGTASAAPWSTGIMDDPVTWATGTNHCVRVLDVSVGLYNSFALNLLFPGVSLTSVKSLLIQGKTVAEL